MSILTKVILITAFIFYYLPNSTLAQNLGDLDTTFGVGGKVITDISSGGAWSIVMQPDGKIILAGYSHPITSSYREITLVRYLSNGDIDNNFGTNGAVIFNVSNRDADVFSVDLQPDGKIVAAGYSKSSSTNNDDFTVVRIDNTGNPDSTFGGDGKVITDIRNDGDKGESLAIQPDGKIIVAGWTSGVTNSDIAVIRLNSNGSLDNSFDGDGIVITDINSMNDFCKDVAIQTDGKIVVAGYGSDGSQFVITVVRYDSTGNLDGTFGTGGIVTTQIGGADVFGQAVTIQQDGKIIVAGKRFSSGNEHFILVRYNTDGNLDNSFGNNGITVTIIGVNSEASSVVIDSNGYIIAGGRAQTSNNNFALARYDENGSLDATFGNSGIVITNMIGSSQDYGRSLGLQSDGKILLAGEIYDTEFKFGVARYIGRLPEINVISPNGGEVWVVGEQHDITWNSQDINNVKIEYTTNNGGSWLTVTNSTPAGSGSYSWTIPNTPSSLCLVRITDVTNSSVGDTSDGMFTILPVPIPIVNVTSPNGGEDWVIGTTQQILWESEYIENVRIEFTIDNGASWETIVDSIVAQPGVYEWIIPETISTQCRVKITDVSDNSLFDVSDGTFTISSHKFTFEAQNTFLSDTLGSLMRFTINVQNLSSQELTLYFKRTINDLPTNWTSSLAFGEIYFAPFIDSIATVPSYGSSPLQPGESREWAVGVFPIQNPGVANIRVVAGDFNNPGDSLSLDLVAAVSDTFLVLYIPNGGENWQVGTNQSIVWNSSNVGLINIDYTTDNGSSWLNIINDYDAGVGSYSWTIPNTPSSQCKVKLTDNANSNIFDQSNSVFTINALPEPELSLIYPNGGEQFAPNDLVYIQWQHSLINVINLEFSDDNGANWNDIIMGFPADSNLYIWIIEPGISSSQCLIKICDFENPQFCDESDSVFAVTPSSSITVLIPNGGEVWLQGTTEDITWTSENVIDVKIELSLNNGASWSTIIESTLSNGIYSWLVNSPQPSTQSLIKISDVSDENIVDHSDDVFTIDIVPGVEDEFSGIPDSYKLLQNYPNPFNPSTTIYYGLPNESSLKITIYDVLGNEVMIYSEEKQSAGYHKMEFDATEYRSGVYFYRLQAGNFVETKKMIFLK